MICPNCKVKMFNGCCLKCGLMENGNYIKHEKMDSKYDKVRNYNEDFDIMHRNENWYVPFTIGSLYFSYRNHLIIGLISMVIELIFIISPLYILSYTIFQDIISFFMVLTLSFVFERTLLSMLANPICIKLDQRKNNSKKSIFFVIIHVLVLILLFYIFRLIY